MRQDRRPEWGSSYDTLRNWADFGGFGPGTPVALYRPRGTKYARGRGEWVSVAVRHALEAFAKEHGYWPPQAETYIEIMGVTADWVADVFHIKE